MSPPPHLTTHRPEMQKKTQAQSLSLLALSTRRGLTECERIVMKSFQNFGVKNKENNLHRQTYTLYTKHPTRATCQLRLSANEKRPGEPSPKSNLSV